jgi:hypothetical protein
MFFEEMNRRKLLAFHQVDLEMTGLARCNLNFRIENLTELIQNNEDIAIFLRTIYGRMKFNITWRHVISTMMPPPPDMSPCSLWLLFSRMSHRGYRKQDVLESVFEWKATFKEASPEEIRAARIVLAKRTNWNMQPAHIDAALEAAGKVGCC